MYSGKVADYDPVTVFFVSTTMTMIPKTSTTSESLLSLYHLSNRDLCISAHISEAPVGGSETELDKLSQVVKHLVDFPLKAHAKIFAGMWIGT